MRLESKAMNKNMEQISVEHQFGPFYDKSSKVLILGSIPSPKSREQGFYYAHPQNRFWKIMERLFGTKLQTIDEKKAFLHKEHIALWDSIASCTIHGSADSAIENATANDIKGLIEETRINAIFTNGAKAHDIYMRYCLKDTGMIPVKLPSTSPANAAYSLDRLLESWKTIQAILYS